MILSDYIWQRLTDKKKQLDRLRPLPASVINQLQKRFLVEWTYHSNAIEGNSLTLKETQMVLENGLTIKGKPLKDHLEATNHQDAILLLEKFVAKKKPLNLNLILNLHKMILKSIEDENAGRLRRVDVAITGSSHQCPQFEKVPGLMKQFSDWLKITRINPVDKAARAHFKLVDIHPFVDGNGRTARLLMNLILMRSGFPPAVILKADRQKYYRLLENSHFGEIKPFVNFVGQATERSLNIYLEMAQPKKPQQAEITRFKKLSEIAPQTPYSAEYLSLLARQGLISAHKVSRHWLTNLEAIKNYQRSLEKKR